MEKVTEFGVTPCLICLNYFDRKPLINGDCSGEKNHLSDFRKVFKLFCKLLGFDLKDLNGVEEVESSLSDMPCCGDCYAELAEIGRLQEIIKSTQKLQQDVLETLKTTLSINFEANRHFEEPWNGVRNQLINCVGTQQQLNLLPFIEECDFLYSPEVGDIPSSLEEFEEPIKNRKRTKPIIKDCYIPLKRIRVDDLKNLNPKPSRVSSNRYSADYEALLQQSTQKPLLTRGMAHLFYHVGKDILLFLKTPIKMSPVGLNCLDGDCNYSTMDGLDYFAFQRIKDHVIDCHENQTSSGICPICTDGASYMSGNALRRHIFSVHAPSTSVWTQKIMCESCQMTLNRCSYPVHVWHHKNETEQVDQIRNGGIDSRLKKFLEQNPDKKKKLFDAFERQKSKPIVLLKETVKDVSAKIIGKINSSCSGSNAASSDSKEEYSPERQSSFRRRKISKQPDTDNNTLNEETDFLLLNDNILLHRGILIKFTPTEFICMEGCGVKLFGCDFNTFAECKKHVLYGHYSKNIFKNDNRSCPICREEFEEIDGFRNHVIQTHQPSRVCPSCWKPISLEENMKSHMKSHMSVADFALAKRQEHSKKYTDSYKKNIQAEKSFACKECPKVFSHAHRLKYHAVIHEPQELRKKFPCPHCPLQLISPLTLKFHIERKHRPDLVTRKKECHICSKQFHFRDTNHFRQHMNRHKGTKFICDKCGMALTSADGLKNHVRNIHDQTSIQLHQCEFCPMKYKSRNSLVRHQRAAHKESAPLLDPELARKSTRAEYLPGFIGPKLMYPCEICEKVFELRSRMTKHVKTIHKLEDFQLT